VAAFPDCFTSLGGNQYINSLAMGRWEDFLIDEMIPALESQLRLRPGRAHRAVFGKSSGGYGAIAHGLRRADAWNAIACHSGDMAFDWVYKVELIKTLEILANHDHSVERFLVHLERAPKIRSGELHALMMLAMAATYDPDPAAYKGVRLPLDRETGAIDEDAWARWMVHDPVVMIERPECAESLRRLAGVWIDCGKRDQYLLHYGSRQLVRRLRALDIPHRYEEFDDDHTSVDYRMDGSLPFLYAALTGALAAT
jgi:S-formylglutathione hydrolase FrmB